MSGLWERVKPTGLDRIGEHMLDAAVALYAEGLFTSQQILDALNARLASPLAGAELTDLANIRAQMDAQSTAINKVRYALKVSAAGIAGEQGAINEATWRSILGIA